MNTTQQPEALRLADKYEAHGFLGDHSFAKEQWCSQAAVELRRQHARIAELEAQLSAIGAGGVEPLRKRKEPTALAARQREMLAADHSGMKVDYRGLFSQVQRALKRTSPSHAEMLRQLECHLQELGQRWYAGDTDVVDEMLQLYCIEPDARKTLGTSATRAPQAQRVPLSDAEIGDFWEGATGGHSFNDETRRDFVRSIEQAHGIAQEKQQ